MTDHERLWIIRRPIAHRRVERLFAGDLVRLGDDEPWNCDACSAELSPHAEVIAAGIHRPSYALCHDCARSVIAQTALNVLIVAACDCPGCENTPRAR